MQKYHIQYVLSCSPQIVSQTVQFIKPSNLCIKNICFPNFFYAFCDFVNCFLSSCINFLFFVYLHGMYHKRVCSCHDYFLFLTEKKIKVTLRNFLAQFISPFHLVSFFKTKTNFEYFCDVLLVISFNWCIFHLNNFANWMLI